MRLGIVTSSFSMTPEDTTNAGVFARDLALELCRSGNQVFVFTPRKSSGAGPVAPFHLVPIYWFGRQHDLASVSWKNPLKMLELASLVISGLWALPRQVQKYRLERLLALWAIPSGLFCLQAKKKQGVPYGVWALGSDIWARKKYPGGDRLVKAVLRGAAFRFADGLTLAREVEQLGSGPCEFLPSVRRLREDSPIAPYQPPPGNVHLLFIGRYERNKGPDILIEAMKLIINQGVRAELHLFGKGSLENKLKAQAAGYEAFIHINGYADRETVIRYMKGCHWLVIPSRLESIPLIFVDALQMRIPVIGTNVGDLGQCINHFGVGKVVPKADPTLLAEVLEEVVLSKDQPITGEWEKALEQFDLTRIARKCLSALSEKPTS